MNLRLACLLGIIACFVVNLIDFHYRQTCITIGTTLLALALFGTFFAREPAPVQNAGSKKAT
ncbi:hypothetical protein OQ252_01410 [Acetobacter farinalis]|uniref:Uncharacterized protein n=1 Tax=Acetobacter farinalis TaxID=1260984 RepID=A0ABT3Q454_9PROT|nr:hypothetical protein [Acetobacter farinalis]MCX2560061.1 hypothetical protein [Acetobacter farinalis]NHO28717.1 hypothetical protein [Acetobacter farinalis]